MTLSGEQVEIGKNVNLKDYLKKALEFHLIWIKIHFTDILLFKVNHGN